MQARSPVAVAIAAALLLTGCQESKRSPQGYHSSSNAGLTNDHSITSNDPAPPPAARVNVGLTANQPYTIAVLGDSTGTDSDEWVHLLAGRIAAGYNRTVTVHDWSVDANGYVDTATYGKPNLPPATIWNGSAAGKGPDYSKAYFASMAPQRADLTIINHGHNGFAIYAKDFGGQKQLVELARDNSTPSGVVAIVLQNPRRDSPQRADVQQRGIDQLRLHFTEYPSGMALIDVNAAFPHDAGLAAFLRPDGFHPNEQGQILWADTVAAVLQIR